MKVLVIGYRGRMGTRYMAILKHLGVEAIGMDVGDEYPKEDVDKAIVCTPTDSHYDQCLDLAEAGIPFLCEKPVCKDRDEIIEIIEACDSQDTDARMVCNWSFLSDGVLEPGQNIIEYRNHYTGPDGQWWDLIQPLYLAKDLTVAFQPRFTTVINSVIYDMGNIESSYIAMVKEWLHNPSALWDMTDALLATERVKDHLNIKTLL